MHDKATGEDFANISARKKKKLNWYFENVQNFKFFIQIFNSFSLIVMTLLIYQSTLYFFPQTPTIRAVITVVAIIILWMFFLTVVQFYSKRVSSKWILRTLVKRQFLITALYTLFSPFVIILKRTLTIYRGEQLSEEQKESLVERAIESMADSAGIEEPLMEEDEREMIENIFELDQTTVKAVMVPRIDIVSLSIENTFSEVQLIVKESGHSRFPVYGQDADDVLGILYVKDLFCREVNPSERFDIRKYIRRPMVIPESKILDELLEELKKTRTHIALVVDEYGGTAGLVTMEDIIEVIVGDIQDEHDFELEDIVKLTEDTYRVSANVSMEELADHLQIELEDEEFETVGGMIYDLAGTLPDVGQVLNKNGLQFTVEKINGQRIETIKIKLTESQTEE